MNIGNKTRLIINKLENILKHRKILYIILIALTFLNLFIFLYLPGLLRNTVARKLSEKLTREVTIDRIRLNPYNLSLRIEGVFIHELGNNRKVFFHCDRISLDINLASVFRRAPTLNELKIVRPYLHIARKKESAYNFSDLLSDKSSSDNRPVRFMVGNITIENGRIVFSDLPKNKKHFVRNMNIAFPFISNFPSFINTYTAPEFSADINGTPFALKGKTKPFSDSLETCLDINIDSLSLHEYTAYVPVPLNFHLSSANLSTDMRISYIQPSRKKPSFSIKGTITLDTLEIADLEKKPLLEIPAITVGIDSIELFSKTARLLDVSMSSPVITLVREPSGITLFSIFRSGERKQDKRERGKTAPFLFDIDNIAVSDAHISFNDKTTTAPFITALDPLQLNVTGLSNRKNKLAQAQLSAVSRNGEALSATADIGLTPLLYRGTAEILKIPVSRYAPYYAGRILCSVADGQCGLKGGYSYSAKEKEFSLSEVAISLKSLKLAGKGGGLFLDVPSFNVAGLEMNTARKNLQIGRCITSGITFRGVRQKDGSLDFLPLVPPSAKKTSEKKSPGKWSIVFNSIEFDDNAICIKDMIPSGTADINVERLSIRASNLAPGTGARSPVECRFLLNGKGTVSAAGHLIPSPFSSEIRISANALPVILLQPYLTDRMNITVIGGSISSQGILAVSSSKDRKTALAYKGDTSIDNFKSVDGIQGNPFVNWSRLSLKQMNIGINPSVTSIEEVSLRDLRASALVNADRKINFLEVMKNRQAPDAKKETLDSQAKKRNQTYIGRIAIQNGQVNFLDKSVEPHYSLNMDGLAGSITGLSSIKEEPADVELTAKVNQDCAFAAKGEIRPLGKELFLNMNVNMSGLDLASATPYSGKYLGYTTEKGRLVLDLDYLIDKRKLQSQNKVTLDQFTLGNHVDSPNATKLPVKFAIVLLRDTSGKIELNLPVSGSLDDPKFKIGPVIIQMLINLIAKAATSPFALLGSVFGGGEELSYIEFDYGTAVVSLEGQKKLQTIVKILNDRPGLSIEIAGNTEAEKDSEALRHILFARKIKVQKMKERVSQIEETASVDDITLTGDEYKRYLWLAYKNGDFKKPRNVLGFIKELPVPDMERALLEHTEVTDNDLRLLSIARAEAAKNGLLGAGIAAERIFLLEPGTIKPGKTDIAVKSSRVDFRLK